jgi:NAD(P)-dependent dehydrogenase (short-subunit alcohol dehydrogenase family)
VQRVALVTGAARSFGRAIAEALAARGDTVAAVDLRDCADTRGCVAFSADVSSPAAVAALAEQVHAALGPVEILVNIAGVNAARPFAELDYEEWRRVQTINLDSQFLMARAFAPDMIERGFGRIVNMASSSIYTTTPNLTAYMASKAGVLGLTSGLANDLGRHGITVNAISPGLTRTAAVDEEIARGSFPEQALEAMAAQRAIPRQSAVADLVGTALFLTTDDAAFVTGTFHVVDGGATRSF